jgi:hypothetical protein
MMFLQLGYKQLYKARKLFHFCIAKSLFLSPGRALQQRCHPLYADILAIRICLSFLLCKVYSDMFCVLLLQYAGSMEYKEASI